MDRSVEKVGQGAPSNRQTDYVWWRSVLGLLLGTLITEVAFTRFDVEVQGEEYLKHSPGALVLSNHRYDSDGPILGGILLGRKGLRFHGVQPYFVAREDLFRRGFLGDYLKTWPAPFRALLYRLSVGPVLRLMRLRPIRRIPEHSLGELLSDVLAVMGDVPVQGVLRNACVAYLARHTGRTPEALSVAEALRAPREVLYQRNAFRRLTLGALRTLKPFEKNTIRSQLQAFVDLLEAGETVVLEPEGTVSSDGRFRRPRGALFHLLNSPIRNPHILPVTLSYDSMSLGRRTRVVVRFGPPRTDWGGLGRRETDIAAQTALLDLWTVTASHLAAYHIRNASARRAEPTSAEALERFVADMIGRCESRGVPVDPVLLDSSKRQRRVAECLEFWRRHKHREGDRLLEFLNNELDAIAAIRPGLLASRGG